MVPPGAIVPIGGRAPTPELDGPVFRISRVPGRLWPVLRARDRRLNGLDAVLASSQSAVDPSSGDRPGSGAGLPKFVR